MPRALQVTDFVTILRHPVKLFISEYYYIREQLSLPAPSLQFVGDPELLSLMAGCACPVLEPSQQRWHPHFSRATPTPFSVFVDLALRVRLQGHASLRVRGVHNSPGEARAVGARQRLQPPGLLPHHGLR